MRSKHTDEQLAWLRGHLPKYEQKTSGATRGDAKKFALDCAHAYIQLWGLPKNANGEVEKESVVKEQIYTWFKNSCARGKDARLKHQQKKALAHSVQTVGMPGYPPPPGMMMPGGVAVYPAAYPPSHHAAHPALAHHGHHSASQPPHHHYAHDDDDRRGLTLPPISRAVGSGGGGGATSYGPRSPPSRLSASPPLEGYSYRERERDRDHNRDRDRENTRDRERERERERYHPYSPGPRYADRERRMSVPDLGSTASGSTASSTFGRSSLTSAGSGGAGASGAPRRPEETRWRSSSTGAGYAVSSIRDTVYPGAIAYGAVSAVPAAAAKDGEVVGALVRLAATPLGAAGALDGVREVGAQQIVDALFVAAGMVLDGLPPSMLLSPPSSSSAAAKAGGKSLPTPVASESNGTPTASPSGRRHTLDDADASGESDPEADMDLDDEPPAPVQQRMSMTASPKSSSSSAPLTSALRLTSHSPVPNLRSLSGSPRVAFAHPTSNERGSVGERSPSPPPSPSGSTSAPPASATTVTSSSSSSSSITLPTPISSSTTTTAAPSPPVPTHPPTLATLLNHLVQLPALLPALHAALRRRSVPLWPAMPQPNSPAEFRARAEARRQHVVWSRVLGASLEVPQLLTGDGWPWFVQCCIEDALAADEEAGWCAAGYLLLALVRTHAAQSAALRALADDTERRWREVRDERRQSEMGEVVLDVRRAFEA